MPAESTTIRVAVRVRPYNRHEEEHMQNQRCIIKVMDKSSLLFDPDTDDDEFFYQGTKQNFRDISKRVNKKVTMDFDRVYDTTNTNQDIFSESAAPLVDDVLNGYNCSVFVYGATGAGKTFTMLGNNNCPGLTFLTMQHLFQKIRSKEDTHKFDVAVSYLEVYNENVMNLLNKAGPLKLLEDANGVIVSGLKVTSIRSAEELLRLLAQGNANRTQHPTDANEESSRSHAIFQVHIRMTERRTDVKRTVKLSMIDLAGSERAASTKGVGMRFKEGASINKSLLALGNCINKLAEGLKHIPYRDSNLTRILKDSLGGNCRTLMVANVSMSSLTYDDTYNTLKYAGRAKKIRGTLRQNILTSTMPKEYYLKRVGELMLQNEQLLASNIGLQVKIDHLEREKSEQSGFNLSEVEPWYTKIDDVYAFAMKTQEIVMNNRSEIKRLSFRVALKKDLEKLRKVLSLDQRLYQEDYTYFTKYIALLNEEQNKLNADMARWRKKLENAFKDIDEIKLDIRKTNCKAVLELYLQRKDLELQGAKRESNQNHIMSINNELLENADLFTKSFTLACDVIRQMYDSLEESQKLTPEIQTLYERLVRKTSFTELESTSANTTKQKTDDLRLRKRLNPQDDHDGKPQDILTAPYGGAPKFARVTYTCNPTTDLVLNLEDSTEEADSDDDSTDPCNKTFKKPRNLNETRVLTHGNSLVTKTTLKPATETQNPATKLRNINHRYVSDILSDQNVHGSGSVSTDKIKNALLKSNKFTTGGLKRTVAAAALQKENLKFGANQVRKSPRALMAKALAGNPAIPRKQVHLAGTIAGPKEAPLVRINRAASFRVKK